MIEALREMAGAVVELLDRLFARPMHLREVWAWCGRWRKVLVPVLAVLLSLGTVTLLVVLSQHADQNQTDAIVRGYDDDRCVRLFAADASKKRTALVDAQASITGETFDSTANLANGLIAGLLQDDEQAVMVAVAGLQDAIERGHQQQLVVAKATREAFAAEDALTRVSTAAASDRPLFDRLCRRGP